MNEESFFQNVASYKFLTKKEVGQNFLVDASSAKRIVDALMIAPNEKVLEVGCGAGSLTYFLSNYDNGMDIIDIDEVMLSKVKEDFKSHSNLNIIYGNAAKYDYRSYQKIIGNLPYYITSLIIENVLVGGENLQKAVFMIQKEAADRLLAKVGTKEYAPLSVLMGLCYQSKRLFNVSRNAFVPAPHVDSTVIEIVKTNEVPLEEGVAAFKLATALFRFRRKTIFNNLKNIVHDGDKTSTILAATGIDEKSRPEDLTPLDYLRLSKAIKEAK